jgi:DNA-binding winged helix-turn-helix (wHTH) protein/TolB-like protein/Tfp pilus assembly protein PilF
LHPQETYLRAAKTQSEVLLSARGSVLILCSTSGPTEASQPGDITFRRIWKSLITSSIPPKDFQTESPTPLEVGRMVSKVRHSYEFGPFRLIPEERQLLRDNQPVPLTPKSFDLLLVLVENSGHLLEKTELMKRVWPESFVEEANLSVNVSALRRALGEGPNEHQYLETVQRRGYRFVASVKEHWDDESTRSSSSELSEDADDSRLVAESDAQNLPTPLAAVPRPRASLRRWPIVLIGLLLVSGLLFGLNAFGLRERLLRKINPVRIQSLAVLPLENLSRNNSPDYFSDELTEALITELAKMGALRVISLPSVMPYKGTGKSLAEVGRDLNVDAVLKGSVTRSGDRVKIVIQLIHTASEQSLWTKTYERELRDVLALQRELILDVGGELRIRPAPAEQVQVSTVRPVNPEAYDEYLRGRFFLNRQNKEGNETAIEALERAVAMDPTFAAAYAELAQAYVWKLFLFAPAEGQWEEKAFVAVEKALSLDPNLAVAYQARGRMLWTPANHFPHEKAIREYRRALSLNPNLDEARNQLALVYCHIGAFDEALQESQKAITTNPNNSLAQFRIGQTLNFQGKYEQALSVLRNIPKQANPALVGFQIAWALFNLGRKEEASTTLEQLLKDHPEDAGGVFTSIQAVLAASAGNERMAQDKIKSSIEKGKGFGHFHHTAYHIACAYALMNNSEQAIKWLEVAADDGFPCYPLFEKDTNLDNLRQDSRFATFLAKQKQQWEYYKTIL